MSRECFIRSTDSVHPDILLKDNTKVDLGRGPITKIKEARCSRKQVQLTANIAKCTVECSQMGGNPSKVGGKLLQMGCSRTLHYKDTIELLPGKYKYTVLFNPPPAIEEGKDESLKRGISTFKRKLSDDSPSCSEDGRFAKRPCVQTDSPFWFHSDTGKIIKSKGGHDWVSCYDGKLVVVRVGEPVDATKVAAFDLDGTIIGTKSGKVFAVDKDDWKILLTEVPGRLKHLVSQGFKIVFITNQAGIGKGKLRLEDFQEKVERIISRLGVPVQLLCSTAEGGFFRKPRTGIWQWLSEAGNGGLQIDMTESFYCGDAAGRTAAWNLNPKTKKDFSCSDRLFALNLGIKFFTPEEFFMSKTATKKFELPAFDPRQSGSNNGLQLLEPSGEPFASKQQEMIIMVGIQGSGKSFVVEKLENSEGYLVASNDRSGGKEKSLRIAREGLTAGKNVVVDNTHRDVDSRKDYIKLAQTMKVPVRCFLMKTSYDQARHNNMFRELTDPSHTKIKEMLFHSFRSKFEEPKLVEGFSAIVQVNFVPQFKNEGQKRLYQSFLLEK